MTSYTIKNGFAITLPYGGSALVLRMMRLSPRKVVVSALKGGGETLELEGVKLKKEDFLRLALVHSGACVHRISNGKAALEKTTLPEVISGLLRCTNPNCVTEQPREPTNPGFRVVRTNPVTLQCTYCERYIDPKDVSAELLGP